MYKIHVLKKETWHSLLADAGRGAGTGVHRIGAPRTGNTLDVVLLDPIRFTHIRLAV